jgi:arginyl-tRNA synthetase
MKSNIFSLYETVLREACAQLASSGELPEGLDTSRITAEEPREIEHGDIATNVALVLAKPAGLKPRDLAEKLAAKLEQREEIVSVDIAGPGFINLKLSKSAWHEILLVALREGERFGKATLGQGNAVNIEYVSANPTGPLHVGHCRGAVVGDALANLLEHAGYAVTREYYINDAGTQIKMLSQSVYLRYREALGEDIGEIPSGLYPGDYLKPVGEALAEKYGDSFLDQEEEEWFPIISEATVAAMMKNIRQDLAVLSIHHDEFFSERTLSASSNDITGKTIDMLRARDLVYDGRLPPPKGQPSKDWEDREQTLFRSSQFGDDVDRPLIKSDGTYTYFASDIAYHQSKFDRGFPLMIDVWGADHGGYVKRMQAAVTATTENRGVLDVKLCQMVRLFRDGKPYKMSKRAGEFVTLRDVVDEVGADAVRFMMLYRRNDATLDFDFIKVAEQSRDNPVFYVQYAYARINSVFRNAAELLPEFSPRTISIDALDISCLQHESEIKLIKRLAHYPKIIEAAARVHEPHRIAFYLYELASDFHALWNRGKELPYLRFIDADQVDCTKVRLAMLSVVAYVLKDGLGVLGVSAPMDMQ